jgi:DNA-binding protein HU-beta
LIFRFKPLKIGGEKIMAKMTKSQLLSMLAEKSGISKKEVNGLMDMLSEMAYKEVKTGGEFVLPGFGKLVKIKRAARIGRNPATGAEIQIPAKTVVKFKVAKAVKDAVL